MTQSITLMRESGYRDLGWRNGWSETPPEVAACRHELKGEHNHQRCVSLTYCDQCKWYFQTDSSG